MLYQLPKLIIIFTLFFSSVVSVVEAENPWQLTKEKEGIQVYVRDNPNSPLKIFRGITTIPAKLSSLVAVLDDIKAMPKLLHDCQSAKIIKEVGNTSSTIYVVTKMPWPVKNRDSVVHSVLSQDKKTKKVLIRMQSQPKAVPLKQNRVRVQTMSGYWEFIPLLVDGKSSGKTKVTYELSLDPGGNLPKWLVNTLAVDFPFNTLKNLHKLVQQPAYKNAKRSHIVD